MAENQLVWYDRAGKPLGNVGAPNTAPNFALSPDEKTVAIPRLTGSNADIWLHEIAPDRDTRFTFGPSINSSPVWSPDGRRIVFYSTRAGLYNLYIKDTTGAGQDEQLLKPGHTRTASDWSRDGRFLL